MAAESRIINVAPGTDLARLLERAAAGPLFLEKDGARFRLEAEGSVDRYDPQAALAGINKAAGSWYGVDGERVKEYIYQGREEGTRTQGAQ